MVTRIKITYKNGTVIKHNVFKSTLAMDIARMNLSYRDYDTGAWVIRVMENMFDIEIDPEEEGE